MCSAAQLREKIELSLAERIPAALSPRLHQAPELLSTGIAEVDVLLQGGLPVGSLAEITGPVCSGRSTLVASILAEATRHGASCAYVDAADAFDPPSAAAIGINLAHLLWVRAGRSDNTTTTCENAQSAVDVAHRATATLPTQEVHCGGAGRHPRMEIRGMAAAVETLFHNENTFLCDKSMGNQATTNDESAGTDFTARCSESMQGRRVERVSVDRQPARRGEVVLDKGIIVPIQTGYSSQRSTSLPISRSRSAKEVWTSLDRALRATDLLLNTGGFRVIVLDMGDVRPEQARRIPLATWYRYRLQAEKSQALFVVLTQITCANSCASVVLRCKEGRERWECATQNRDGWPLLAGFQYSVSAERKRATRQDAYSFGKKPVSAAGTFWQRTTLWAR